MSTSLRLPLLCCAVWMVGCGSRADSAGAMESERGELVVYAATSTRDALLALASAFERQHGVELVFNFGSSGDLARQILAAAQADVFLSADDLELDRVERAALLRAGTRCRLLTNQLVVIEPADVESVFTAPFDAGQLAAPRVRRLSLGNVHSVPAGRYAQDWLARCGVWEALQDRVLPANDVRAALAAVESGAAEAGIVYKSDAARSSRVRLVYAVPLAQGPAISYPAAVIAGRPNEDIARAWLVSLHSAAARATFESFGFLVAPTEAPR